VTTIVPLRPYSAKANILPEQTLGRGLRRMTPPGQANEVVTVVDHPAFRDFYRKELEQEGAIIEEERTERVPATTVSIFPDEGRKDLKALELVIPRLGAAHRVEEKVEGLTIDDVRKAFERFKPLPLGRAMKDHIDYEGRHLVTDEVVERTKINLPLLKSGVGAVGYYVKELEHICKIRGLHAAVGGLLQTFLEEILFEKPTTLFDPTLVSRLADSDVREHIRAVFVPLVRARTVRTESRTTDEGGIPLSTWRPFQVTHSERHPVLEASKTLFNLVPCNRELELAVARYLDAAGDVAAFAKNAGPQALRIDYLTPDKRLAFYTPDFFARSAEGRHYLIETKGREDKDVPRKARAAMAWCAAASASRPWQYVYVPQGVFERLSGATKVEDLARACEPALSDLMETENDEETRPLLALMAKAEEKPTPPEDIVPRAVVEGLPERARRAVEQATALYRFFENKEGMNFAPTFTALLGVMDDAARVSINARLLADVPTAPPAQRSWFEPHLGRLEGGARRHYEGMAQNLKKTLLYQSGVSPLGLLRSCLDYALNDPTKLTGVFDAVRAKFRVAGARDLLAAVSAVYEFRNTVVAHQEKELTDPAVAKQQLLAWVHALRRVHDLR
jgi:type III restriction enzyme